MPTRSSSACALLLGLALGSRPAYAETPAAPAAPSAPSESPPLTWPRLLDRLGGHPRLAESRARVAAAEAEVAAAGQLENPSVDVSAGRGTSIGSEEDAQRTEWGVELSVPLEGFLRRGPRVDAARATLEESRQEAAAARLDLLVALHGLFWSLAHGQARVASLQTLEAATAQLAELVRRRVDNGEARPIELARAEIELERARTELDGARTRLGADRDRLALSLEAALPSAAAGADQRAGEDLRVEADLSALPPIPSRDEALSRTRQHHPTLEADRARVQAAAAGASAERRARIPAFAVKGFGEQELDRRAFGVGLSVELPVWNWNSGRIAQAEASREAEARKLEADERAVAAEILEARRACELAGRSAERMRTQVLPRAERAAQMLERSFQVGEATLLDIIDANRVLGETQRELLAAQLQAQLDCGRLNLLLGEMR